MSFNDSKYLKPYQLGIIGIYTTFFFLLMVLAPNIFNYTFSFTHIKEGFWLIIITTIICALLNRIFGIYAFSWINPKLQQIFLILLYATLIAIPEELIFREIIQSHIKSILDNDLVSIFLASAIFGLAHLPNWANGGHFREWNWKFAWVAFILGMSLGYMFVLTESLFMPTLFHASIIVFAMLCLKEKT